jgi:hypothetical protein
MERGFDRWEKTALAFAWLAPVATRELARLTYVPIGFLSLATIFLLILHRARAELAETAPQPAGMALSR